MRFSKIPFKIVLIANILPWFAAFFDSKLLTLLPDLCLFLIVFSVFIYTRRGLPIITTGIFLLFFLILIHTAIVLIDGRGIGSGGSLLLVTEIYCFSYLLRYDSHISSAVRVHNQITFIYKMHLVFIVFELIARCLGSLDFFVSIVGNAETVMVYKTYNTAALLQYFGMNGLNSMLLGSQIASQLILFSLIWFFPFYRRLKNIWGRQDYLSWFLIALIFYPLCATMTVNIILLIYFIFFIVINNDTVLSKKSYKLALAAIVVIFIEQLIELLAFRINEVDDIKIYANAFTNLVDVIDGMPVHNYLYGWGSNAVDRPVEDANFGLGMIFYQAGLLFAIPFSLFFYLVYRYYNGTVKSLNFQNNSILSRINALGMLNILIALGWWISLIHYTPAIELGGRQLFAFHVAIVIHITNILLRSRSKHDCPNGNPPLLQGSQK